jgi:predicted nucleic acid-binding protein
VIVVDANVAAKWYLPEPGSEAALELMAGPNPLVAPDLIRLEVLSAITRRVRTREATVDETEKRCKDWRRHLHAGAVSLVPEHDLLDDAVRLAMDIRHTLQDCLYLALAKRLDATLLTADRPFHERAKASYTRISLLPGCESN